MAPTFRDPEGFCVRINDRVFRVIYLEAAPRVQTLVTSRFVAELVEEGYVPHTRLLPEREAAEILADERIQRRLGGRQVGPVLEHRRIEFESGPHEWCPEMLFAAGELTLQLQLRALDAGLTMKDATPANILFDGAWPVFVDLLSFAPRPAGMSIWPAYAQFVRTFLLPLLLYKSNRVPPNYAFFTHRDGLEPHEVYSQLSLAGRLGWSALPFATLPTLVGRSRKAQEAAPADMVGTNNDRALSIVRMIVQGLNRSFRRLRPNTVQRSDWSEYMRQKTYCEKEFGAKEAFVASALRLLAPKRVLDVGCNTGHFSRLASSLGASVVALDYDPVVVGQLWAQASAEKQSILPLVLNLARPSPGLGWRNAETRAFLDRAVGKFDAALLLAVIHHVSVTDGVPLSEIFQLVSELVGVGAIVEYVPPSDPMFRRISRNKWHLIALLNQQAFETAFQLHFESVRAEPLASGRCLYYLKKRQVTTGSESDAL